MYNNTGSRARARSRVQRTEESVLRILCYTPRVRGARRLIERRSINLRFNPTRGATFPPAPDRRENAWLVKKRIGKKKPGKKGKQVYAKKKVSTTAGSPINLCFFFNCLIEKLSEPVRSAEYSFVRASVSNL